MLTKVYLKNQKEKKSTISGLYSVMDSTLDVSLNINATTIT